MQRFFIEKPLEGLSKITIYDKDILSQLKKVLRFTAGDRLVLLDNSGFEYLSEIALLSKESADLKILSQKTCINTASTEVWLLPAVIKKDKLEWVVEKGTELGVAHFVPILSDRSEKKNLNFDRLKKIAKEASEQSGRGKLPEIHDLVSLDTFLSAEKDLEQKNILVFDPIGELANPRIFLEKSNPVYILIGPEGGWSHKELERFKSLKIPVYSLGKQTLRAETASIVTVAKFLI